jgi:hypothetical protein
VLEKFATHLDCARPLVKLHRDRLVRVLPRRNREPRALMVRVVGAKDLVVVDARAGKIEIAAWAGRNREQWILDLALASQRVLRPHNNKHQQHRRNARKDKDARAPAWAPSDKSVVFGRHDCARVVKYQYCRFRSTRTGVAEENARSDNFTAFHTSLCGAREVGGGGAFFVVGEAPPGCVWREARSDWQTSNPAIVHRDARGKEAHIIDSQTGHARGRLA